jgi:hypothetical protein
MQLLKNLVFRPKVKPETIFEIGNKVKDYSTSGLDKDKQIKFESPKGPTKISSLDTKNPKFEKLVNDNISDLVKKAKKYDPKPIEISTENTNTKLQFSILDWKPPVQGVNVDATLSRRQGTFTAGNAKLNTKAGIKQPIQFNANMEFNAFKHIVDYNTIPKFSFLNLSGDMSLKKVGQDMGQWTRNIGFGIGTPPLTDEEDDRVVKKIYVFHERTDPRTGEGQGDKLVIEDLNGKVSELLQGLKTGTMTLGLGDMKEILKGLVSYETTNIPRAMSFTKLLEAAREEFQNYLEENEEIHQKLLVEHGISPITGEGTDQVVLAKDIMTNVFSGLNGRIEKLRRIDQPMTEITQPMTKLDAAVLDWSKEFCVFKGWALDIEEFNI